jgi:hypothetical protein
MTTLNVDDVRGLGKQQDGLSLNYGAGKEEEWSSRAVMVYPKRRWLQFAESCAIYKHKLRPSAASASAPLT